MTTKQDCEAAQATTTTKPRVTFTNAQLMEVWGHHSRTKPKGTRRDVVVDLMKKAGLNPKDEKAYARTYNNVQQRVRHLSEHPSLPLKFPELAPSERGHARDPEELRRLQALLDGKVSK